MSDIKAERETIIRWDEESPDATFYTASPAMARRCAKWGWPLGVHSTYMTEPRTWQGIVPKRAIRVRKRATLEKLRPAMSEGAKERGRKALSTFRAKAKRLGRTR